MRAVSVALSSFLRKSTNQNTVSVLSCWCWPSCAWSRAIASVSWGSLGHRQSIKFTMVCEHRGMPGCSGCSWLDVVHAAKSRWRPSPRSARSSRVVKTRSLPMGEASCTSSSYAPKFPPAGCLSGTSAEVTRVVCIGFLVVSGFVTWPIGQFLGWISLADFLGCQVFPRSQKSCRRIGSS